MVEIPNCGVCIVTPAVVFSKVCSKVLLNRLTSVEVPPISKPIIGVPSFKSLQVVKE